MRMRFIIMEQSQVSEIIAMAWALMNSLKLTNLSLLINTIGDSKCRPAYIEDLKLYYSEQIDKLCGDCQNRLNRNALRLLDCKKTDCMCYILWYAETPDRNAIN